MSAFDKDGNNAIKFKYHYFVSHSRFARFAIKTSNFPNWLCK